MIKPSRSRNVQIDKYLSVHVVRISRILRFVDSLKLPPKSKALDVGCYPPLIFNSLRQRHFDTSGVTHFGRSDKSKKIYLVNIDVNPLPFPDGFFDLVIFTEIIEHLTNPFFALSEIRRVLKPGGWLLITTPNVSRSQNVIKLIFNKNIYPDLNQIKQTSITDQTIYHRHNREYTVKEIADLVSSQGLRVVRLDTFVSYTPFRRKNQHDPFHLRFIKTANYLIMLVFPHLRDTIFLAAVK